MKSFQPERPFTLYFVRHGVTESNLRGFRCGGDLDLPMMDLGSDQVYQLAKQIETMKLDIGLIITGSLLRTRQTATIISAVLGGLPIIVEPLLNERRLGQWNNRSIAETEGMLKSGVTPPGGEAEQEFAARVASALEGLRTQLNRRPLIVSSKGVARVLANLLGAPQRLNLANGQIVEFSLARPATGHISHHQQASRLKSA